MNCGLFVYGTLMAEEVVEFVLKNKLPSVSATLSGYKRVCLKNRVYPGIIPASNSSKLNGKVLLNLKPSMLVVLDDYECEYSRIEEEVTLEDGSSMKTFVYVWASSTDDVIDRDWDYTNWRSMNFRNGEIDMDPLL